MAAAETLALPGALGAELCEGQRSQVEREPNDLHEQRVRRASEMLQG